MQLGTGVEKLTLMPSTDYSIEPRSYFFPNYRLDTKELNYTLSLVPLIMIYRLNINIVLLTRKCFHGSVPPYFDLTL